MSKRNVIFSILLAGIAVGFFAFHFSHAPAVKGWTPQQNKILHTFLKSDPTAKIAVFDIDGTLIGQAPHYLADEAIFAYADAHKSELTKNQTDTLNKMLNAKDNASPEYVQLRIEFLDGMMADEITELGNRIFKEKFSNKIYPEMQQLVKILHDRGWAVYGVTASPEFLYQGIMETYFNIPKNRVIGTKGIVVDTVMTGNIVHPVPQDSGKPDTIYTFIKTVPSIVGGNSMGDYDMVKISDGLRVWVNAPERVKQECADVPELNCLVVYSDDIDNGAEYSAGIWGMKKNKENPKK